MIAAEEGDVVGQEVLCPVAEGESGAPLDDSLAEQMREIAIPCDLAEADDDADLWKCGDLGC